MGEPCGGRCGVVVDGVSPGTQTVCDVPSGRCLPVVGGCECALGFAVNAGGGGPLVCEVTCGCAALPAIQEGRPGVFGKLHRDGEGLVVTSYEPEYGDLVASRFVPDSALDEPGREGLITARVDTIMDGLPVGGPVVSSGAYRGGVAEPGPDVGDRPEVVVEGGTTHVVYRDRDGNRIRYGRFEGGMRQASMPLPVFGLASEGYGSGSGSAGPDSGPDFGVGRFQCLVSRSDGTLAGLAFVGADPFDQASLLVRFESRVASPVAESDWVATTVIETPLPPREAAPCGDACGLTEACVVAPSGQRACAALIDLGNLTPSPECAACTARQVCGEVEGVKACHPRVERRDDVDRLPFGEGLFVSCTLDEGGQVVAAWYDADRRRLVAGRWPFSSADRVVVDVGPGRDPGRFTSVAADGAGLAIAYQDAGTAELKLARAASWGAPWSSVIVPTGAGEHGIWARLRLVDQPAGAAVIAAGEGESGDILVFAERAGCWGSKRALSNGVYLYPDLLVEGGDLWVSARALTFDESLVPRHAPVLARVTLPGCAP